MAARATFAIACSRGGHLRPSGRSTGCIVAWSPDRVHPCVLRLDGSACDSRILPYSPLGQDRDRLDVDYPLLPDRWRRLSGELVPKRSAVRDEPPTLGGLGSETPDACAAT